MATNFHRELVQVDAWMYNAGDLAAANYLEQYIDHMSWFSDEKIDNRYDAIEWETPFRGVWKCQAIFFHFNPLSCPEMRDPKFGSWINYALQELNGQDTFEDQLNHYAKYAIREVAEGNVAGKYVGFTCAYNVQYTWGEDNEVDFVLLGVVDMNKIALALK